MPRLPIKRETLNAIFAKSGNVCAFPGCTHELVTKGNLFVAQICHIEAARPGGQRYNAESTDEERRSADNLILLCYKHHRETDDVSEFEVGTLRLMKLQHESVHGEKTFKINEAFLRRLEAEMQVYWDDLKVANSDLHVAPDFAVEIGLAVNAAGEMDGAMRAACRVAEILSELASYDDCLNDEIREHLARLGYDLGPYDEVRYFENPFIGRNWEVHALAANNALTDLNVALDRVRVRFLEEYVKTNSTDTAALEALREAKAQLRQAAVSAGYAD